MKRITVTEDMVKYWFIQHRESRSWAPKKPYCKLCSVVHRDRRKADIKYLPVGLEVMRIDYPNGTFGLYHPQCIEAPKNRYRVENLFMMDVDRWDGIEAFIEELLKQNLTDDHTIKKIMERFDCSYATGWRKLKAHRKNNT